MGKGQDRDLPGTSIVLALVALSLIGIGEKLALEDRSTSAGTCFGFGVLLVALALLSKFKRIKGFGFEAEMWDQEQLKAAMLVGKLEQISKITTQQLALFAANLGLLSGDLTVSQKEQLLRQLENLSSDFDSVGGDNQKVLLPLVDRIFYDYCWAIDGDIRERLKQIMEEYSSDINSEKYNSAVRSMDELAKLKSRTRQLDHEYIDKIKGLVQGSMFTDAERADISEKIRAYEGKIQAILEKRRIIRDSI